MKPLKILYLAAGGAGSTSLMKARALDRLGHDVQQLEIHTCVPEGRWSRRLHRLTGYALLQRQVARRVLDAADKRKYDAVWVDSGYLVGPGLLRQLRLSGMRLINYNHDDPTGARDGNSWATFKRAVPEYDLMVTVRRETEEELGALGARRVLRVWRGYDEVEHRPRSLSAGERAQWTSEVLFVGTWMPERGRFMAGLLDAGVPVAVYGDHWPKAAEWPKISAAWRGPAIYGDDYAKAIQCSKVALGLLSKANRDLHTTRTAEIPALGGLLCAERTDEHLQLFRENKEAVFWSNGEECAAHCFDLLRDDRRRTEIAFAGKQRVQELGLGHERILSTVLASLEIQDGQHGEI